MRSRCCIRRSGGCDAVWLSLDLRKPERRWRRRLGGTGEGVEFRASDPTRESPPCESVDGLVVEWSSPPWDVPLRWSVNVNCDGEGRMVFPDASAVQDPSCVSPRVGCLGLSCSDEVVGDVASLVEITSRSPSSESESHSAWVLYRTDSDSSEESGSVRVTTG